MISDLDIFRTASILVKKHDQDAPIQAAMRVDKLLEEGDLNGYGRHKFPCYSLEQRSAS